MQVSIKTKYINYTYIHGERPGIASIGYGKSIIMRYMKIWYFTKIIGDTKYYLVHYRLYLS